MDRIIYDTFTDSDSTVLTDHTPDTRPYIDTYWEIFGTWDEPVILSNSLNGDNKYYGAVIDANSGDVLVRAEFYTGIVTTGFMSVVLRAGDGDYLMAKFTSSNRLTIIQVIDGVETSLKDIALTWVNNTTYTLEFGAVGDWCRAICKSSSYEASVEVDGISYVQHYAYQPLVLQEDGVNYLMLEDGLTNIGNLETSILTNAKAGIYFYADAVSASGFKCDNFAVVTLEAWSDRSLAALTMETARVLQIMAKEGQATGGSTTTLLDTALSEPNDYLTGGTIWIKDGLYQSQALDISAWDSATFTFTFATRYGRTYAGDKYAAANCDFPLWLLKTNVNSAIKEIGKKIYQDSSTTTVAEQRAYTLPAGINKTNLKMVEIGIGSSAPIQYYKHHFWDVIGDQLIFQAGSEPDGGYNMLLTYVEYPAALVEDSDTVPYEYNLQRIANEAAGLALHWRIARTGGQERIYAALLVDVEKQAAELARTYPMPKMQKTPKFRYWGLT